MGAKIALENAYIRLQASPLLLFSTASLASPRVLFLSLARCLSPLAF